MSTDQAFTTIRSVGGLLPTSLLGRLADLDRSLPGTTPASFGLDGTAAVRDPIAPAWTRLKTRWAAFNATLSGLGREQLGTSETRDFLRSLLDELGLATTPGSVDVGEDRYPVSHVADHHPVPVHLLSTRVDIDRRTKGVDGAATRAPHALVQELLNRSDDHLWALVAGGTAIDEDTGEGGLVLRLLRDNQSMTRQAYVEFDLAGMFDGDVYADFVVLWLALHHTRFAGEQPSDCLLEQWLTVAEDEGARVLEKLSKAVEKALKLLGTGLLRHPENTELRRRLSDGEVDAEELYRQLLRVVYRLLFLFVAEDRDLLLTPADEAKPQARERYTRWYSTARLRSLAREVGGGRHPDLWRQLVRVLHELGSDTGCEGLALPPLGGGLFASEATHDVVGTVDATTALSNGDLLDVVRALAWTVEDGVVRSVDFRNLGAEELGSVYESLLELVPRASASGKQFTLETVAGNARKSTGSYYTPTSLIKILLDEALDPLLDEAEEADDPAAALLSLTVCDPASGSGHFLVAAANRIAERLAAVRSGDSEPSPVDLQQALRDVVSRCIYGVDVNPMAAELAKVTLWLECHVPGQPMTFLDHHIKVGNTLIGVGFDTSIAEWNPDGKRVADRGGIPDDAFRKQSGDEKPALKKYKSRSRALRDQKRDLAGQGDLLALAAEDGPSLHELAEAVDAVDDSTVEGVHEKERRHRELVDSYAYTAERLKYDAWCAAWTMTKTEDRLAEEQTSPIEVYYLAAADHDVGLEGEGVSAVIAERDRLRFFHWAVEFPRIAELGGFDLVVGNPPWEKPKPEASEWFAEAGRDEIAGARTAAMREALIEALEVSEHEHDRSLYAAWVQAQHDARCVSQYIRNSGRFPDGGVGDVNTYAVIADHASSSASNVGMLVPTAFFTGATYSDFFVKLLSKQRLVSVYSASAIKDFFPDTTDQNPFCAFILRSDSTAGEDFKLTAVYGFRDTAEISLPSRRYQMSLDDVKAVSPGTPFLPAFRGSRDAGLVTKIYRRLAPLSTWGIYSRSMIHMSGDSESFRTLEELEDLGATLIGNKYVAADEDYLPLYEGKLVEMFSNRTKTFDGIPPGDRFKMRAGTNMVDVGDPSVVAIPRYWVPRSLVEKKFDPDVPFFGVWKAISDSKTSARGLICAVCEYSATTSLWAFVAGTLSQTLALVGILNNLAVDYVARLKLSGNNVTKTVVEQIPVPPTRTLADQVPWRERISWQDWIVKRVVALTGTSELMSSLLGLQHPIAWDDQVRREWRTELDAAMFFLYGYSREDIEHAMSTFAVLNRMESRVESGGDDMEVWNTTAEVIYRFDSLIAAVEKGSALPSRYELPSVPLLTIETRED